VPRVTGTEAGAVVNTHSSPGSAPQNGPQVPRRAASQISWSERAAGGLAVVVKLVSKVPLLITLIGSAIRQTRYLVAAGR
jgi:hypothetical protein